MSFAKDDIGLTNTQAVTQASTIQTRIVKESSEPEKVNTENAENIENTENQERLTISENLDKRLSMDSLEQNQENVTKLDIINNSYTAISDTVSEMEKQVKDAVDNKVSDEDFKKLSDSVKSKLEDIEETIKNTTFDGKNLFGGNSDSDVKTDNSDSNKTDVTAEFKDTSLTTLGLPNAEGFTISSQKDAEALVSNLDNAKKEIARRQTSVSNSQNEIKKGVRDLFLTEINLLKDGESDNNSVEQTKNNVISGILDDPSKNVKMQIKSIDTGVLIALVRLHVNA